MFQATYNLFGLAVAKAKKFKEAWKKKSLKLIANLILNTT